MTPTGNLEQPEGFAKKALRAGAGREQPPASHASAALHLFSTTFFQGKRNASPTVHLLNSVLEVTKPHLGGENTTSFYGLTQSGSLIIPVVDPFCHYRNL